MWFFGSTYVNTTVVSGENIVTTVMHDHPFIGWMAYLASGLFVLLLLLGVVHIGRRVYVDCQRPVAAVSRPPRVIYDGEGPEGTPPPEVEGEGETQSSNRPPVSTVTAGGFPGSGVTGDEDVEAIIARVMSGGGQPSTQPIVQPARAVTETSAITPKTLKEEMSDGYRSLYTWAVQFGLCVRVLISVALLCMLAITIYVWFGRWFPTIILEWGVRRIFGDWFGFHDLLAQIAALHWYIELIKNNTGAVVSVAISWFAFIRQKPLPSTTTTTTTVQPTTSVCPGN